MISFGVDLMNHISYCQGRKHTYYTPPMRLSLQFLDLLRTWHSIGSEDTKQVGSPDGEEHGLSLTVNPAHIESRY